MFVTTDLFNQLISQRPDVFASVKTLLFGGSAVDPRWVREALTHGSPQRLLHVYGPTESTTFATWYVVREVPVDATTIPIGRPISNTRVYVLDEQLEPVPIGVAGELYIGGAGVARGYLNRPELTAERFVVDPFGGGEPSDRLYRTGDLVRYRADGNLEFLGRLDHQVKIRGFRVEPGEVEATLRRHPAVRDCVVVACEDATGGRRLVAYVVPTATTKTKLLTEPANDPQRREMQEVAPALRRFAQERLPEHMVPSAFVVLEALPLTPNGKVDRRALPAPEPVRPELEAKFVAPRTEVERRLAEIWSDLLGLKQVGVNDDFFVELGGHSLIAIQLLSRVRDAFQLELPVRRLFEAPKISALAPIIEDMLIDEIGELSEEGAQRLVTGIG